MPKQPQDPKYYRAVEVQVNVLRGDRYMSMERGDNLPLKNPSVPRRILSSSRQGQGLCSACVEVGWV